MAYGVGGEVVGMTSSATLPKTSRPSPLRPWVERARSETCYEIKWIAAYGPAREITDSDTLARLAPNAANGTALVRVPIERTVSTDFSKIKRKLG